MRITVLKRSGKPQKFSKAKIARSINASGAGWELAQRVAQFVYKDLVEDLSHFSNQLVPTSLIRNKVARYLHLAQTPIARKYLKFRKKVHAQKVARKKRR